MILLKRIHSIPSTGPCQQSFFRRTDYFLIREVAAGIRRGKASFLVGMNGMDRRRRAPQTFRLLDPCHSADQNLGDCIRNRIEPGPDVGLSWGPAILEFLEWPGKDPSRQALWYPRRRIEET